MNSVDQPNSPNPKRPLRSLQSQYIIVALLLGLLVLIGAATGYLNIISTSSQLNKKADSTASVLGLTTDIRKHTNGAYRSIHDYLLNPDQSAHISNLIQEVYDIQIILESLIQEDAIKRLELQKKINTLNDNFQTILEESTRLFEVRVTPNDQYPALAIASNIMEPLRNEIFSAFNLSLLEFQDDPQLEINSEEYVLLNKALLDWMTTISEYRLYLMNRMGTFDPDILLLQEAGVGDHALQVKALSLQLLEPGKQERLGFEGSHLISKVPGLIDQWLTSYQQVVEINHSEEWRKDIALLANKISPLMDTINQDLKSIDMKVKQEYQSILINQTSASTKQNYILISIIVLFITYIIISIKLLQHFIIRPIATMASAMKDDAFHHGGLHTLRLNKTRETQDLIDAFTEMSHQVFKRQDELEYQATHDSLTGLPNRMMLHQRLDYHLLIASRERQSLIFMMMDLNRFKEINDTLGHHIGDNLLVQVGERISQLLRSVDTIARLGGDEFAILLPNTNHDQAAHVSNTINKALAEPFNVNDYELQVSGSIGIAEFPSDGTDSNTLMQHADVAMYISKREKSGHHFYSASEDSHSIDRLSLASDLKAAIENDQLELHYQPKYQMTSKQIIGAEALLRWQHPELGHISPETIVEMAEETGIIDDLSHWVIQNAIAFCGKHASLGYTGAIAVNLSVHNLRDPELIPKIESYLEQHKVDSSRINIEITESAVMTHPEKSIQALKKLHQLGVKLSVDDFGTGFSSLAYLKLLPVVELKIDKSFIMDMEDDESDRLIVHSIIELGHNLGLEVVAEGIENENCWNMLREMNCDMAQGYFMSRPLDSNTFTRLLQTSSNHICSTPERRHSA